MNFNKRTELYNYYHNSVLESYHMIFKLLLTSPTKVTKKLITTSNSEAFWLRYF